MFRVRAGRAAADDNSDGPAQVVAVRACRSGRARDAIVWGQMSVSKVPPLIGGQGGCRLVVVGVDAREKPDAAGERNDRGVALEDSLLYSTVPAQGIAEDEHRKLCDWPN